MPAWTDDLRTRLDELLDEYRAALLGSLDERQAVAQLRLEAVVDGHGQRPVWALHLQVLRELAQHAGHADILREQVLARRDET